MLGGNFDEVSNSILSALGFFSICVKHLAELLFDRFSEFGNLIGYCVESSLHMHEGFIVNCVIVSLRQNVIHPSTMEDLLEPVQFCAK
jgi:hypothetical protein